MTDYVTINDTQVEPDAPVTTQLMTALRDNPLAISEGSSGAPRIANEAFANGTIGAEKLQAGTDERNWVLARTAAAGHGAVGTYAMMRFSSEIDPGDLVSGVTLTYSGGSASATSHAATGTWKCMGALISGSVPDTTLFLRVI